MMWEVRLIKGHKVLRSEFVLTSGKESPYGKIHLGSGEVDNIKRGIYKLEARPVKSV